MNYLQERIEQVLGWVHQRTVMDHVRVENISYVPCDYKGVGHTAPTEGWKPQTSREDLAASIPAGGSKTAYGEYHAWFKATVTIPESMKGKDVELMVHSPRHSNPQYIVYIDGKIVSFFFMFSDFCRSRAACPTHQPCAMTFLTIRSSQI